MGTFNTLDVNKIWESLGTFWGQFPDKELFSELWGLYYETVQELFKRKIRVHLSKYMKSISPVLEKPYSTFTIDFTTDTGNVIEISGLNSYYVNDYLFSIPTLSGLNTGQLLIEGVDYQIYQHQYVQFLSTPTYDTSSAGIADEVTLYAEDVFFHNPVLWEIHASGIGLPVNSLDNEEFLPYNNIASSGNDRVVDIAEHYRYLIWSLTEIKRRQPTIKNLEAGYGISRGLPFVYRAGTVNSIVDSAVSIAVSGLESVYDEYIIPSGYTTTAVSGIYLDQFEVLISGIRLHDHVNDYDYIMARPGVNEFNYTSNVVFTYPSNFDDLNFSSTFHASYVSALMPKSLTYTSIAE